MNKTFVIGDIHGQWEKLQNLLNLINFDYENDRLITLGDYGDGRKDALKSHNLYNVVEILLKCKNRDSLLGNHDDWIRNYLNNEMDETDKLWWIQNGGEVTKNEIDGYIKNELKKYNLICDFMNSLIGFIKTDKHIFVHGGFSRLRPIEKQNINDLIWDRNLVDLSMKGYDISKDLDNRVVFLGHTCTQHLNNTDEPIFMTSVIACDTGAGYGHKLTAINLETLEYFQT